MILGWKYDDLLDNYGATGLVLLFRNPASQHKPNLAELSSPLTPSALFRDRRWKGIPLPMKPQCLETMYPPCPHTLPYPISLPLSLRDMGPGPTNQHPSRPPRLHTKSRLGAADVLPPWVKHISRLIKPIHSPGLLLRSLYRSSSTILLAAEELCHGLFRLSFFPPFYIVISCFLSLADCLIVIRSSYNSFSWKSSKPEILFFKSTEPRAL